MSTALLWEKRCPFSDPKSIPLPVFQTSSLPPAQGLYYLLSLLLLATSVHHTHMSSFLGKKKKTHKTKNPPSRFHPVFSSCSPSSPSQPCFWKGLYRHAIPVSLFSIHLSRLLVPPSLHVLPRSPLISTHLLGPFGSI